MFINFSVNYIFSVLEINYKCCINNKVGSSLKHVLVQGNLSQILISTLYRSQMSFSPSDITLIALKSGQNVLKFAKL